MKKMLSLMLVLSLFLTLFPGAAADAAAFPGEGSGIESDPYIITNAEEFSAIRDFPAACFRIEAAAADGKIVLPDDFTPIPSFQGYLEGIPGKNTIVANMVKTSTDAAAAHLFFNLSGSPVIKDLVIEGTFSGGAAPYTSALVGYIHKNAVNVELTNIINKANVTVTYSTNANVRSGGLVGFIQGSSSAANITIQNCSNHGEIKYTGTQTQPYIGGIVGYIDGAGSHTVIIDECRNYGNITSSGTAAGILGVSSKAGCIVRNCANLGTLDLQDKTQGAGIVNNMTNGTIEQCFNAGKVMNGNGGCAGIAYIASTGMTIRDCYNAGTVTGSTGGAAGIAYNIGKGVCSVSGCYNTGSISGTNSNVGPIYAATNASAISSCYHLPGSYAKVMESSEISPENLKAALPAGFDPSVWKFTTLEADGTFYLYPQLINNIYDLQLEENFLDFAGGCGTQDYPYLIATKEHLSNVSLYPFASFKLLADIVEAVTAPVNGMSDFSGSFDGNGKNISLAITSQDSYVGLFSRIVGGSVRNLTVTGSVSGGWTEGTVDGSSQPISGTGAIAGGCSGTSFVNCVNRANVTSSSGNAVGGIAGDAYYYPSAPTAASSFTQCKNYGSVTGASIYVAGIIGIAAGSPITYCANYGDINGKSTVGGITGKIYSNLTNCLNAGSITADSLAGGIGGEMRATYGSNGMENCYNIGTVRAKYENGTASAFGTCGHSANLVFTNCYNAGDILSPATPGQQLLSMAMEGNTITYTNCYALTANAEADGLSGISGVTAVTPATLKTAGLGSAYTVDASVAYPYPQLISNPQTTAWDFALLTVSVGENGTASFVGSKYVKDGISYPITFTPDETYELDKVFINTVEQPDSGEALSVPVSGDTTVSATFAEKQAVAPSASVVSAPFIPDTADSSYTFATINYGYGYEVTGYGILYSEDPDAITNAPETCETILEHVTPANGKGQFGIQLTGELPAGGYYTRAYVTYKNTATQETFTVYSDVIVKVK